jgi:hypothetical protein
MRPIKVPPTTSSRVESEDLPHVCGSSICAHVTRHAINKSNAAFSLFLFFLFSFFFLFFLFFLFVMNASELAFITRVGRLYRLRILIRYLDPRIMSRRIV